MGRWRERGEQRVSEMRERRREKRGREEGKRE